MVKLILKFRDGTSTELEARPQEILDAQALLVDQWARFKRNQADNHGKITVDERVWHIKLPQLVSIERV